MLITDVPRVLPDTTPELNAPEEKRENEKTGKNAEANFTSPRRKYCTAQRRLCDHSPKQTDETGFDSLGRIAFETALRFIRFSSDRQSYDCGKNPLDVSSRGRRYGVRL